MPITVPIYQGGDLTLTSEMPDAGVPSAAGRAHFIAPCSGRVVSFSVVAEDGLSLPTTFNLDFAIAADTNPSQTYTAPATAEGETVVFQLDQQSEQFQVGKGVSFFLVSGGEGVSTRKTYVTVIFRPDNPTDLPTNAYIITGVNPDGTAAFENDFHVGPIGGGGELIYFATSNQQNITTTYTCTALKNGTDSVAVAAITTGIQGRVTEVDYFVDDADRFFGKEDHLAITGSAAGTTAGAHPFIAIFRPVGVA